MIVRMIVACQGFNGPDLYFVKVEASKDQIDNGDHYKAAENAAAENDYEGPMVAFDETDFAGKAMLPLFANWDAAEITNCG